MASRAPCGHAAGPRSPLIARSLRPSWLIAVALAATTAIIYGTYLDRAPIYLNNDEAAFALQGYTLATSGRDTNGRLLPLYFQVRENVWYHPVIVYAMAGAFSLLPFAEWTARVPTVIVAIADVLLVYAIGRQLWPRHSTAVIASVMLALTPAHFMHGRLGCDYLYPLPFVLAWLYCLLRYLESGRPGWALGAAAALGTGVYSYIASVVMMPFYLALTLLVLAIAGKWSLRVARGVAGVFLACLLPLAAWLIAHPEMYAGLAGRYRQYNLDIVGRTSSAFDPSLLIDRAKVFVRFFEPSFLFNVAESNVMSSTYTTGIFLKAVAVLMVVGLIELLRRRQIKDGLLLALFVTAPLAASLIIEPYAIDRALILVPAGILIAAAGVDLLLRFRVTGAAVVVALLAWQVWQFDAFYRDYLHGYRTRSAFWFNGNNRGAMQDLMATAERNPSVPLYLAENIPFIDIYWNLYLRMAGREHLSARTTFFNAQTDVATMPAGSIVLTNAGDPIERTLLARSDMRVMRFITEPDGSRTFVRFEKLTP